ncbi:MAG TPA: cytochrome c3 family protein, partial [Dissulfurispiraceae bacterium]
DQCLVEGDFVSLVVKVNGGAPDALKIIGNKGGETFGPLEKGKEYYCRTIRLDPGPNEIAVEAVEKGVVVGSKKVTVFRRSDISRRYNFAPPEFERAPFHEEAREAVCKTCHRMDLSGRDVHPARIEESMCFQCHRRITSYSNVHGPAARWDCLTCHERDSKPQRFATRKPEKELCYTCHKEKQEEWTPKKYFHGPTATGKCSICHSPHASDNPFWLKKTTWNLCVTCHEDRASGAHVVVGIGSGTHPTKGKPDPLRYGKELTCASCHNPHASNSKSLFSNNEDDPYSLCKGCHKF